MKKGYCPPGATLEHEQAAHANNGRSRSMKEYHESKREAAQEAMPPKVQIGRSVAPGAFPKKRFGRG